MLYRIYFLLLRCALRLYHRSINRELHNAEIYIIKGDYDEASYWLSQAKDSQKKEDEIYTCLYGETE